MQTDGHFNQDSSYWKFVCNINHSKCKARPINTITRKNVDKQWFPISSTLSANTSCVRLIRAFPLEEICIFMINGNALNIVVCTIRTGQMTLHYSAVLTGLNIIINWIKYRRPLMVELKYQYFLIIRTKWTIKRYKVWLI